MSNILRTKCNQNIPWEKPYNKCGGEACPGLFHKKSILSVSLDQQSEMLLSLSFLYVQVEVYQNILKLRCWPPVFAIYKAVLKNKKRFETSLHTSFSSRFLRKKFLMLYSINWPYLNDWLLLILEILSNIIL